MTLSPDPRRLVWGLLGLWVSIELLHSSRWWPPQARPRPSSTAVSPAAADSLRSLLSSLPRTPGGQTRVWFAPYTTFPETGFVESTARAGVYDTFLAIPSTGVAANYGASKLSPADTLFSLAAAYGLPAELRLARRLGFGFFALDLGAVSDPAAAQQLCLRSNGCRLTADAYALIPITAASTATSVSMERGLASLMRRIPLLPQKSAGPSWGPLVLPILQWTVVGVRGGPPQIAAAPRLLVQARPLNRWELYRYPLDRYPVAVQPWLRLDAADIQLELAPDVEALLLCIGPVSGPCRPLNLGGATRRLAIGDLLPPAQLSRLELLAIRRRRFGLTPFSLELRAPVATRALLGPAAQPGLP